MEISNNGIELIVHFESLHDGDLRQIGCQPKKCPVGIWTVGYGHALTDKNGHFLKGDTGYTYIVKNYPTMLTLTEEQAREILTMDLKGYSDSLSRFMTKYKVILKQNEFDAIMSFIYNCGMGAVEKNGKLLTMGRVLCDYKRDSREVESAFNLWVKGDGKVLKGLVLRRYAEANLFNKGILHFI